MSQELILKPEELYFMGSVLQGRYIDYAYVAAMGDIQQNRALYESEARNALASKGVLEEDFSGDLMVDREAESILAPVFFGELETALEVNSLIGDGKAVGFGRRFHFHDGRITETMITEDGIWLRATDAGSIQKWIGDLFREDLEGDGFRCSVNDIEQEKVQCIVTVKTNHVGDHADVCLYMGYDNRVLMEQEEGVLVALSHDEFCQEIYQRVKGE